MPEVVSHTDLPATVRSAWLDGDGRLYLDTDLGFGIVHSQDVLDAAEAIEAGVWTPEPLDAASAPARFGFALNPAPAAQPAP